MRKNKNGFTLIELLGVIIVIAIVALISVPIIAGVIEKARIGALKATANGLLESAEMYYAKNIDKVKSPVEFVIINGKQTSIEKLDYKGNVENGYLMLFKNNKKAVCVDNGTHAASKSLTENEVTVQEGNCLGYDEEYKGYLVGGINSGFTSLDVKGITDPNNLGKGTKNAIRIITETKVTGFYVASVAPEVPSEGMVWVVQANNSPYYLESNNVRIGVSYAMQYESGKWNLKKAYVYNNDEWKLLYYVDMTDGNLNLENSNLDGIELEKTYEYTGEYQEFTAPFSGYYNIQAWGAQGGNAGKAGGLGAYTSGDIYLNANDTLYIYVGGTTATLTGGWNGGGKGLGNNGNGRGGGGSTDIRLSKTSTKTSWNEFDSLKSRIMVAAGGSGASNGSSLSDAGSPGGGLYGYDGTVNGSNSNAVYHGTQSMYGYYTGNVNFNGGFGYGGSTLSGSHNGGGGGSGYYGGGAGTGNSWASAGSTGSSYISGHEGVSSISDKSTIGNIIHNGSPYHYSGYYFINTLMIDGYGYTWTDVKTNITGTMPSPTSESFINGNSGNGYAKIKLKSIEINNNKINEKYSNNFSYSNNYQEFKAPSSGTYKIEAWGAQGGNAAKVGGLGSYTSGNIYLNENDIIYIYVGGSTISLIGGWNGGGNGRGANGNGAGGGGATDIRLVKSMATASWNEFDSLKSRIMVAAGGSGASNGNSNSDAGIPGGGLYGYNGSVNGSIVDSITFGTQSKPGLFKGKDTSIGGFGYGGNSVSGSYNGGGGGSGYYGGGSGTGDAWASAGSSGSSYISGHEGVSSIERKSTENAIIHNGSPYHYSGYYFTNTQMIDGTGYSWTTYKTNNFLKMPDPYSKNLITGNIGNGYARITFISDKKEDTDIKYNHNYSNNNKYQIFEAPKNGIYKIELWGAQGGNAGKIGGLGSYTSGEITLSKGTKLYVYVGETTISSIGGWNGGGNGRGANGNGRGGGGSTDVRINQTTSLSTWNEIDSLKSRIMVAAGGSGASNGNSQSDAGSPGGGLIGYNGTSNGAIASSITYGTQISPGLYQNKKESIGGFGYGGSTLSGSYNGGGGGSGWYGGGSGTGDAWASAGASGSSYISGHAGCIAVNSSANPKTETYMEISDSVSYTGSKFINTLMVDGNGYSWTTVKSNSSSGMPSPTTASLITGNTGDGYARITYLGE